MPQANVGNAKGEQREMATVTASILTARAKWKHHGTERPPFAVRPSAGQESVWDYPRPPRLEPDSRHVQVFAGNRQLADSHTAVRVLETASPPTFYLPPADVDTAALQRTGKRTTCEWKGIADAFGLADDEAGSAIQVAWAYFDTFPEFEPLRGYFAFYPAQVRCLVAGEEVQPQPGSYYGGWITREIVGPFKGEVGSDASW